MTTEPLIVARGLTLAFGRTEVLRGVDLDLPRGEVTAVMGPSGSGKSTLLHGLAGLLVPDSGSVVLDGRRLDNLPDRQRSRIRLTRMGFVFQFGDLVPELSMVENVELPLRLTGATRRGARAAAMGLLAELEVDDVADRRLNEVSGGQAQRVAVARALVAEPDVVFADEPTGSLDLLSGERVLESLVAAAGQRGTAVLMVTHEHRVASYAARTVTMLDGVLRSPSPAVPS